MSAGLLCAAAPRLIVWTHYFRRRSSHRAVQSEIAVLDYAALLVVSTGGAFLPQHRLNFSPDLHGQGALRGIATVFPGWDWVCFVEFSGTLLGAANVA